MHVNGCHIVSTLCTESAEGFRSSVTRGDVTKGPFLVIKEAVECARDWDNPVVVEPLNDESSADAAQAMNESVLNNESPATTTE